MALGRYPGAMIVHFPKMESSGTGKILVAPGESINSATRPTRPFEMNLPWSTLNNDPSDAGCSYPPHQTMGPHYHYEAKDSVHRIPFDRLAEFAPNFDSVIFERHAKHRDLMASAPIRNCGWLISDRFLKLLSDFNLPPHRAYRIPVIQDRCTVEGYNWLHLPQPIHNLTETISISEAELTISREPTIADLDVLPVYTPVRFAYYFVSWRLRQAITKAQLTGIRFGTSKLFRAASAKSPNNPMNPSGGSGLS